MGKASVHVLIPFTTDMACGDPTSHSIAYCRRQVTCKACKKSEHYKNLRSLNLKTKREKRK